MKQNKQKRGLPDPIVEQVREVRERIDEEVGHDIVRLAERVKRIGEHYRRKLGLKVAEIPPLILPPDIKHP